MQGTRAACVREDARPFVLVQALAQAIDLFKRALKSQPRGSHILYSLAAAQVRSGQTDEGLKTLKEAVDKYNQVLATLKK